MTSADHPAPPASDPDRTPPETWSRPEVQSSLRVIVDAVVEALGYGLVVVSAVYGGDELRVVAAAGREDATRFLRSQSVPVAQLMDRLVYAEHWGALRFVPAGADPEPHGTGSWTDRTAPADEPADPPADGRTDERAEHVWHVEDRLFAPIVDLAGHLLGVLAVDLPRSRRRPDAVACQQLEVFVALAARTMTDAARSQRDLERKRAADAGRVVVRLASAALDTDAVLAETVAALVSQFGADAAWVRSYATNPGLGGELRAAPPGWLPVRVPDDTLRSLRDVAEQCWKQDRVLALSRRLPAADLVAPDDYEAMLAVYDRVGFDAVLMVPLGVGGEFLGHFAVARTAPGSSWSEDEQAEALSIGRDVGRAVQHARTFARERELVARLRSLDDYQRELVSIFSHELRTPLSIIGGHLELLEHDLGAVPEAGPSMAAVRRGMGRLDGLVTDLVLVSRVLDVGHRPARDHLDLAALVRAALPTDPRLAVELGSGPVPVVGDAAELTYAIGELLGRAATARTRARPVRLVLSALDGMARLDVHHHPGTDPGPGFRVAERVAERHGGHLDASGVSRLSLVLPLRD